MPFTTQAYKGTRDFYPEASTTFNSTLKDVENSLYQEYIFDTWTSVLAKHGFSQYSCSLLEQAEIYIAKSGEELGSSQLYSFTDKGDRKVALRPELTPSLARMVADKQSSLRFPLRWFSIPNCFRYEAPQKGRLREHWQLNADVIGLPAGEVELEMLFLTQNIFTKFGAKKDTYKVLLNSRKVLDEWLKTNSLYEKREDIYKILDSWHKLDTSKQKNWLIEVLELEESVNIVFNTANKQGQGWQQYLEIASKSDDFQLYLKNKSIFENTNLDITIIRGQAYYTGLIWEVFDANNNNPRSLLGGGRYDNLMELFDKPKLEAIGFGSGDVTLKYFLENHNLLDGYEGYEAWKKAKYPQKTGIMLSSQSTINNLYTNIIPKLKAEGKSWDVDYEYTRNPKKRRESLIKRGCNEVIDL